MAIVYGHIVGINGSSASPIYKVVKSRITVGSDKNSNIETAAADYTAEALARDVSAGKLRLVNAEFRNGVLHGITGSLERFNVNDELSTRTKVIIAEIRVAGDDRLLGYTIADRNGNVSNRKADVTIDWCKQFSHKAKKSGSKAVPIQNYIYVAESESRANALKSYDTKRTLVVHRVINKVANVQKADVDLRQNAKSSATPSLADIFTREQIKELKLGRDAGLNIRVYANPKLSAEQMRALRKALSDKVNPMAYAGPEFSAEAMRAYTHEIKHRVDIRKYINPKYSAAQIYTIGTGFINGVDISKFADPSKSVEEMDKIRIALECDLWGKESDRSIDI